MAPFRLWFPEAGATRPAALRRHVVLGDHARLALLLLHRDVERDAMLSLQVIREYALQSFDRVIGERRWPVQFFDLADDAPPLIHLVGREPWDVCCDDDVDTRLAGLLVALRDAEVTRGAAASDVVAAIQGAGFAGH